MTSHFLWLKQNCFTVSLAESIPNKSLCRGNASGCKAPGKLECNAHVQVKLFTLYPEFAISQSEREGLSKWKLRCMQEEKIKMIKKEIEAKTSVKTTMKYFISLPREEAHSGHPTGQAGVYAQKLTPSHFSKIVDMVEAGITDTTETKHTLKYYVGNSLSKEIGRKPCAGDRAFYPLNEDIRNHVGKAKRALELSKYVQENL